MKPKNLLKYGVVVLVTMFAIILPSLAQMNTVYFNGERWEYSMDKVWDDKEGMYVLNIVILSTSNQDQWFVNFPSVSDLNIEIYDWFEWDDELGDYVIRTSYEGDDVIVRYKISDALYKYESSYYWSNSSGGYIYACDVTEVGSEAFMNYAVIENFYAEELVAIGNSAFEGCMNLAHPEDFTSTLGELEIVRFTDVLL